MKIYRAIKTVTVLVAAAMFALPAVAGAQLTARANHDHITMDIFYHGNEVSVRGICDPGVDLVVKIESEDADISLKKKDKVGGILWMNTGEEEFKNVPELYFMQSSGELDAIAAPEEQDRYVMGYKALENHAAIEPAETQAEKDRWFSEFVKFKEASRLYFTKTGGFEMSSKDGVQSYFMKFDWPYQAKPGDYRVTVLALKDGKVVETANSAVKVEQVGMVKTLSGMAKNKGALYGGLSVIIALAAGFGVGIVFKKGGGAH